MTANDASEKPPAYRLAAVVLAAEGMVRDDGASVLPACAAVTTKLHEALRPLVGSGGFESILGRAGVLGARRHPELGRLRIPRDGPPSVGQLAGVLDNLPDRSAAPVAETLVAEFLAYLARLVGWPLTVVLMEGVWPRLASDPVSFELMSSIEPDPPEGER